MNTAQLTPRALDVIDDSGEIPSRTPSACSVGSGEVLHPATADLVSRFTDALSAKLLAAQKKYGYGDGWLSPDWMDECRAKLLEHVAKGDPRDVAAYCAFLWHHGESTAALSQTMQPQAGAEHSQLMKFYGVDSVDALVAAQADHITKLQDRLPRNTAFTVQRVREG